MKKSIQISIVIFFMLLTIGLIFFINVPRFGDGGRPIRISKEQLREEINKLFSEDEKVSVYPKTKFLIIKQGETDGFGIRIKNLENSEKYFSYNVFFYETNQECEGIIKKEIVEGWIGSEKSGENIFIQPEEYSEQKILFNIPNNAPLCNIGFKIEIMKGYESYANESLYFLIKPL